MFIRFFISLEQRRHIWRNKVKDPSRFLVQRLGCAAVPELWPMGSSRALYRSLRAAWLANWRTRTFASTVSRLALFARLSRRISHPNKRPTIFEIASRFIGRAAPKRLR